MAPYIAPLGYYYGHYVAPAGVATIASIEKELPMAELGLFDPISTIAVAVMPSHASSLARRRPPARLASSEQVALLRC